MHNPKHKPKSPSVTPEIIRWHFHFDSEIVLQLRFFTHIQVFAIGENKCEGYRKLG